MEAGTYRMIFKAQMAISSGYNRGMEGQWTVGVEGPISGFMEIGLERAEGLGLE